MGVLDTLPYIQSNPIIFDEYYPVILFQWRLAHFRYCGSVIDFPADYSCGRSNSD